MIFPRAFALVCLLPVLASAGGVDRNDSAAFSGPGHVLRFDYANDYFTGTDRYYTQGIGLQYFFPALKRDPGAFLILRLPGDDYDAGLVLRNSGFTPSRLTSDAPLAGDRPFAATLTAGHVVVSHDRGRGLTLTAELEGGVIGQAAGGKWQQAGIHRATGNMIPRGWDNQIRNDLVLDYSVRLEKTVIRAERADAGVYGDMTAGTLYDNAALGVGGRVGAIDAKAPRRFYLFGRAENALVAYDATLQGGMLNHGSPYVLTSPQIRRDVLRAYVGFVLDWGRWALDVTRTYQSREFIGGLSHEWVEISVIRRW
ncbi:MAG: lipid A deacylase LpxR family protein [Elusimicrobia bacterium]|nr:lipid A deacylase LpxR family protein [Elusimicrobiota bacterium]